MHARDDSAYLSDGELARIRVHRRLLNKYVGGASARAQRSNRMQTDDLLNPARSPRDNEQTRSLAF